MQIPHTLTDQSLTVLGADFMPKTLPSSHPAFEEAVAALQRGDSVTLYRLLDLQSAIVEYSQGEISVADRQMYFRGRPIDTGLTRRILQFMESGQQGLVPPLMKFLEKVLKNPSRRAVQGLFEWVERSNLPITPDGDILAWKVVKEDFTDIYSGQFDNSVGNVVEVPRNEVDENPDVTCSYGLHFCSTSYLTHAYVAKPGYRLMMLRLDPADVVAFPRDYGTSKGRTCRYTVIGEVPTSKAAEFFPSLVEDPLNEDGFIGELDEILLDRYYLTRAGDVVRITHYSDDDDDEYPVEGEILGASVGSNGNTWTDFGAWRVDREHPNDLVELLPEDFEPPAEPRRAGAERPKGLIARIFGL